MPKTKVKFDIKPVDDRLYGLFEDDKLTCLSPKKSLLQGHVRSVKQEDREA